MNSAMWSLFRKCQCSSLSLRYHRPGSDTKVSRLLAMQPKDRINPRVVCQAQAEVHPSHLLMRLSFSLTLLKPLLKVLLLQLLRQHVICLEALRSRQLAWQSESSGKEAWSSCS